MFELVGEGGPFVTGRSNEFRTGRSGQLVEPQISELELLWNALPVADQDRCHVPRIGFEVSRDNVLQLRAAVCYECSNISIRLPAEDVWRAFDPESAEAQRVLQILSSALMPVES